MRCFDFSPKLEDGVVDRVFGFTDIFVASYVHFFQHMFVIRDLQAVYFKEEKKRTRCSSWQHGGCINFAKFTPDEERLCDFCTVCNS